MKAWRVFYTIRGAGRSTVVSAADADAAETTFRHHHRGCVVERVEPADKAPAPAPVRPRPPAPARVRAATLPPAEQEQLVAQARQLTAELRARLYAANP